MTNWHAEVINLSLKDKTILKRYAVQNVKKRFFGLIKIYTLALPENEAEHAFKAFQTNLGTALKKEWYITFHSKDAAVVVFRQRIFRLSSVGVKPHYQRLPDISNAPDKENWAELIAYARSLGVPENQCDFLPENFSAISDER